MPLEPSILVVDDYADGREMLVEYLAFRGFRVTEASGGEEALELARTIRPDVVLMDVRMPGVDGWEATRALKADSTTKDIIIVALTAHALKDEVESARAIGCDAVISKPFDMEALGAAIRRVRRLGRAAFGAPELSLNRRSPNLEKRGAPRNE